MIPCVMRQKEFPVGRVVGAERPLPLSMTSPKTWELLGRHARRAEEGGSSRPAMLLCGTCGNLEGDVT